MSIINLSRGTLPPIPHSSKNEGSTSPIPSSFIKATLQRTSSSESITLTSDQENLSESGLSSSSARKVSPLQNSMESSYEFPSSTASTNESGITSNENSEVSNSEKIEGRERSMAFSVGSEDMKAPQKSNGHSKSMDDYEMKRTQIIEICLQILSSSSNSNSKNIEKMTVHEKMEYFLSLSNDNEDLLLDRFTEDELLDCFLNPIPKEFTLLCDFQKDMANWIHIVQRVPHIVEKMAKILIHQKSNDPEYLKFFFDFVLDPFLSIHDLNDSKFRSTMLEVFNNFYTSGNNNNNFNIEIGFYLLEYFQKIDDVPELLKLFEKLCQNHPQDTERLRKWMESHLQTVKLSVLYDSKKSYQDTLEKLINNSTTNVDGVNGWAKCLINSQLRLWDPASALCYYVEHFPVVFGDKKLSAEEKENFNLLTSIFHVLLEESKPEYILGAKNQLENALKNFVNSDIEALFEKLKRMKKSSNAKVTRNQKLGIEALKLLNFLRKNTQGPKFDELEKMRKRWTGSIWQDLDTDNPSSIDYLHKLFFDYFPSCVDQGIEDVHGLMTNFNQYIRENHGAQLDKVIQKSDRKEFFERDFYQEIPFTDDILFKISKDLTLLNFLFADQISSAEIASKIDKKFFIYPLLADMTNRLTAFLHDTIVNIVDIKKRIGVIHRWHTLRVWSFDNKNYQGAGFIHWGLTLGRMQKLTTTWDMFYDKHTSYQKPESKKTETTVNRGNDWFDQVFSRAQVKKEADIQIKNAKEELKKAENDLKTFNSNIRHCENEHKMNLEKRKNEKISEFDRVSFELPEKFKKTFVIPFYPKYMFLYTGMFENEKIEQIRAAENDSNYVRKISLSFLRNVNASTKDISILRKSPYPWPLKFGTNLPFLLAKTSLMHRDQDTNRDYSSILEAIDKTKLSKTKVRQHQFVIKPLEEFSSKNEPSANNENNNNQPKVENASKVEVENPKEEIKEEV